MTKHSRIVNLCLAVALTLVLLANLCMVSFAAVADLDRKCSITFTMVHNGKPLTGGNLKMYRIASWVNANGEYTFQWVPELADAGLNLAEKDSEAFARHVFMLIESRSLPAVTREIGLAGFVTFTDLDSGLYVVYQTEPAQGYEPINAFCVSLPMSIAEGFVYDVQAKPKPRPEKPTVTQPSAEQTTVPADSAIVPPESATEPQETTSAVRVPTSLDKLPQTGQLWWPTWTLGIFGVALLGFGVTLRSIFRDDAEENES